MSEQPNDDLATPTFRQEAERLAKLQARQRKAELVVHWRIANDPRYKKSTRDYARHVAETLKALIEEILPSIK